MGFELHKYNIYSVSLIEIMLCFIAIANWKPGVQFFRLLLGKGYKKNGARIFLFMFWTYDTSKRCRISRVLRICNPKNSTTNSFLVIAKNRKLGYPKTVQSQFLGKIRLRLGQIRLDQVRVGLGLDQGQIRSVRQVRLAILVRLGQVWFVFCLYLLN